MADFSKYQQKVIQRYYDNREQIDHQRLSELATELYLASGKKLEKLWTSAQETMQRMKVPPTRIDHVMAQRDPAVLAEVVTEINNGKLKLG